MTDPIHSTYLAQLQGLEAFRKRYRSAFSTAALERDDPELKRLTEALAYCTAHAQHHGQQAIEDYHERLFSQLHPYLATPLPAKILLQARPGPKMRTSGGVEAGAVFEIQNEQGNAALFQTCLRLNLLPLSLVDVAAIAKSRRQVEVRLTLNAFETMSQPPGDIPVYLNVHQDLVATFALHGALRQETKVEAYYDQSSSSFPCTLHSSDVQWYPGVHPIESMRHCYHFPYAEFFKTFRLTQAPPQWRTCELRWRMPADGAFQNLTPDCFRLFCAPAINLHRENARPLTADATRSHYPILPETMTQDFMLHSVVGVYQTQGERKEPLLPSCLQTAPHRYSVVRRRNEQETTDCQAMLDVYLPEALQQPRRIKIDARWHQPTFSRYLWQKLAASPYRMDIAGVGWQVMEARQSCQAQALATFDILAIQNHDVVSVHHLNALFDLISAQFAPEMAPLVEGFAGFTTTAEAHAFDMHLNINSAQQGLALWLVHTFERLACDWFAVGHLRLTLRTVSVPLMSLSQ